MAGLLESLFSGGASALGATQQIGANTALGDYAVDESRKIGTDAMANSTFQPFSVASQTGNSQVGADGSVYTIADNPFPQIRRYRIEIVSGR